MFYDINFIIKLNFLNQFKQKNAKKTVFSLSKSLFNFLFLFLIFIKHSYFFKKTKISKTDKNLQLQYMSFLFFFKNKKSDIQNAFYSFSQNKKVFFKQSGLNLNTIKIYKNHQIFTQIIFNKINVFDDNLQTLNFFLKFIAIKSLKRFELKEKEWILRKKKKPILRKKNLIFSNIHAGNLIPISLFSQNVAVPQSNRLSPKKVFQLNDVTIFQNLMSINILKKKLNILANLIKNLPLYNFFSDLTTIILFFTKSVNSGILKKKSNFFKILNFNNFLCTVNYFLYVQFKDTQLKKIKLNPFKKNIFDNIKNFASTPYTALQYWAHKRLLRSYKLNNRSDTNMPSKFLFKKLLSLSFKKLHMFNNLFVKNIKAFKIFDLNINQIKNKLSNNKKNKEYMYLLKTVCMSFFETKDKKILNFLKKNFFIPKSLAAELRKIGEHYLDKKNNKKFEKIEFFLNFKYKKSLKSIINHIYKIESSGGFKDIFLKKLSLDQIQSKIVFSNNFDSRYLFLKSKTYCLNNKNIAYNKLTFTAQFMSKNMYIKGVLNKINLEYFLFFKSFAFLNKNKKPLKIMYQFDKFLTHFILKLYLKIKTDHLFLLNIKYDYFTMFRYISIFIRTTKPVIKLRLFYKNLLNLCRYVLIGLYPNNQIYCFINFVRMTSFNSLNPTLNTQLYKKYHYIFEKNYFDYKYIFEIFFNAFRYKNINYLVLFIKDLFRNVNFYKHQFVLYYLRCFLKLLDLPFFEPLNVRGVFMKFHGKIAKAGNSRRKKFLIQYKKIGTCYDKNYLVEKFQLPSFTGVVGCTLILCYS